MSNVVGTKGQIVIEKPIRDALQIKPGSIAVQNLVGDHIEVRFLPPEHDRSLHGALAPYVEQTLPPEEWDEERAKAWTKDEAPHTA